MNHKKIKIEWPNGELSTAKVGESWLETASNAGFTIPTGCLGGSCGACEIEVNGEVIRACVNSIPASGEKILKVEFSYDPYW